MSVPRSFRELLGDGEECFTTVAYWLGPFRGEFSAKALLEVGSAISFQYDFEEQADAFGSPVPDEESWPRVFSPVAPIQLAAEWSPLPSAVEVLGEPSQETSEADSGCHLAVAAWDSKQVAAVRPSAISTGEPALKRFLGLLSVSVIRAKESQSGLLIAAKPGWSYEHVRQVSGATARLMTKAGFVVTTRRP